MAEVIILDPVRQELLSPERVDRMAREIEKRFAERMEELADKSTPEEIRALDARPSRGPRKEGRRHRCRIRW